MFYYKFCYHACFDRNGERRSSESGCESDGSDYRAPGCNRPPGLGSPANAATLFGVGPAGSLFSAIDYEQKKLLATKGRSLE